MQAQAFPYWRISAYYFFYFAFVGGFSPYFGLYLQSLSFSAWDIGVLMSLMQLMRLFGPYLWGTLADRLNERLRIVRITSALTLAAFSLFFFVHSFGAVFAVLAVLSVFWVASLPLVETLTFDHLRGNPGRYSRIRIWGSIGFIVVVLIVGGLLDRFGLRLLLWVDVMLLVGIVLSTLVVPEARHVPECAEQPPIGQILAQPRVRGLLVACFAMTAAHGAFNIFYSIFLTEHGHSKSVTGALWTLGVLAEIVVFYYMTTLLPRFGLRRLLLASFAAAVVRFAAIGIGGDSLAVLIPMQLMHGLTFGAFHAAAIAAINRWFAGSTRARGQALYSSVSFGAGGLVGGLASGWAWDALGGAAAFVLSSLYALIGLVIVALTLRDDEEVPAAEAPTEAAEPLEG
ncbi:MFS transporter [uncultured Propionivibrio sp.]|uniref:MFS transporter n=1 Tax=uncultured Propionivibrio sp. TaxID=426737 RepID=UPI0029C0F9E6|nr:MFS transporter [uncultured Propionivibrio sp.]